MLGTAACEDNSCGDGSYGTPCYTEETCDGVTIFLSGGCGDRGAPIKVDGEDAARCVLE